MRSQHRFAQLWQKIVIVKGMRKQRLTDKWGALTLHPNIKYRSSDESSWAKHDRNNGLRLRTHRKGRQARAADLEDARLRSTGDTKVDYAI